MSKHLILSVLTMSILSGCASLAPEMPTPAVDLPESFNTSLQHNSEGLSVDSPWWTLFDDAVLNSLVDQARARNLDIRKATTQIDIARAMRREAGQSYLPKGGISAELYEVRKSALETGANPTRADQQSLGAQAQWEIDLFGRIHSANQAALAQLGVSEALREQVLHSVTSEVIRTYFEFRSTQDQLAILLEYRQTQSELVELVRSKMSAGAGRPEDLERALAQLNEDEATISLIEARLHKLQHALAALVHEVPGEFEIPTSPQTSALQLKPLIASNPKAWLRHRPDIRAAEKRVQVEAANIGIATADLFPQLSIDGFFGFVTGHGDSLVQSDNQSWFIGPTLRWGIFDLGKVKARIQQAEGQAELALLDFERTVLQGLAETQTAFSDLASAQKRIAATQAQATHAQRAENQIKLHYQVGTVDFLELLDAKRSYLRARLAQSGSIEAHRLATVDVFRTFGVASLEAKTDTVNKRL